MYATNFMRYGFTPGMGATYIVLCEASGQLLPTGPVPRDSLRAALLDGRAPAFLEPVTIGPTPLKVWRLKALP